MVKEAIFQSMDILLDNCRDKKRLIQNIKGLQLSRQTMAKRSETFDEQICKILESKIKDAKSISICLDESTDLNDNSQLIIWVRIVDKKLNFSDEILDLENLKKKLQEVKTYSNYSKVHYQSSIYHSIISLLSQ